MDKTETTYWEIVYNNYGDKYNSTYTQIDDIHLAESLYTAFSNNYQCTSLVKVTVSREIIRHDVV